jgi:hypothetical protein
MTEPFFQVNAPSSLSANMTYNIPNVNRAADFVLSQGCSTLQNLQVSGATTLNLLSVTGNTDLIGTLKVNSISPHSGTDLNLAGNAGNVSITSPAWLVPSSNGTQSLGHPSVNWNDLNLAGGVFLNGNGSNAGAINFQQLTGESSSGSVVMYKAPTGEIMLQSYFPNQVYNVLSINAPTGSMGGAGNNSREATLSLVRADGSGNSEFVDLYCQNYTPGFPTSHEAGIRIQSRGTGTWTDFVFDYSNGTQPFSEAMRISGTTQNVSTTNSLSVGRSLQVAASSTLSSLYVSGTSNLHDLAVSGASTLSALSCASLSCTSLTTGNVTCASISASGSQTLAGSLNVFGAVTLANNLNVVGDVCSQTAKTDYSQFMSFRSFSQYIGSWNAMRNAQNNWSFQLSPSLLNATLYIDLTNEIRTSASKGFQLTSFDVIYSVAVSDLNSTPSEALAVKSYANNSPVSLSSVTVGGTSYATAVQANPYKINRTISSPSYLNSGACLSMELTFPTALTTVLNFYGIQLNFTRQSL